jgi:hypothetical protein
MKAKLIITGVLVAILSSASIITNAQQDEPAVKILPTNEKGVLKVLYAYPAERNVLVKFFDGEILLSTDKVKGENLTAGFMKKYDVSSIDSKSFWIEVSGADVSVTYKLIKSKDGKSFEPLLEKTIYNHPLVASK